MTLRDSTSRLLRSNDIVGYMRLADAYIRAYNKVPTKFVLPKQHEILKPVIEAFAKDTGAFADYIRILRDSVDGVAKDELHDLYRSVSVRALQVVRRTRLRKALVALLPQLEKVAGRPLSYEQQMLLLKQIEHEWGKMRMDAMSKERTALKSARINSEERTRVLDQFWADMDKAIERGDIPLGRMTIKKLVALLPEK